MATVKFEEMGTLMGKHAFTGGEPMNISRLTVLGLLLTGLVWLCSGCSSSSTSPSETVDWFLNATWVNLADFTGGSYLGGALEWDGDDSVYALRGNDGEDGRQLWRYDISSDTWTQLADGFSAYWSSCLAYTGGDHIYGLMGNGTSSFYRYTISTDDWDQMESFPESGVRRGARTLVWPGTGDYLYAIKGNETGTFARYSQSGDSWEYLTSIPEGVPYGGSICWGGGDYLYATAGDSSFYRYDIGSDSWNIMAPLPRAIDFGSNICFDGDRSLFMFRGAVDTGFWRYDITDDEWKTLEDTPGAVDSGGALASDGEAVYALPGGGSTEFWAFKP